MVSIIIPSRNEKYLEQTVKGLTKNAKREIEIIVIKDNPSMRTAVNEGVARAKGKYIMKLDAHCMVDYGYDVKLVKEHHDNWIQIPRRKRLDAAKWELIYDGRPDIDYMYLDENLKGRVCGKANKRRTLKKKEIDDIAIFQGSCYFMTKEYFNHLGLLDDVNFGGSGNEATEIMLKCWKDGGRLVRNKKTWYAHAHLPRPFSRGRGVVAKSRKYIIKLAKEYGYTKDAQKV